MRDIRPGTTGRPPPTPPPTRPASHIARALQAQDANARFNARGVQAQPASKQAKPLTHDQQLQLAVDSGLQRSGITQHIQTSGIASSLRPPAALSKTFTGLGEAGLYALPGAAIAAKNVGQDLWDASGHGRGNGDLSFKRTRKIGSALVHAVPQDIQRAKHGDLSGLILDASAAVSAGAGAGARVAAASRALRAGESVGSAVARKGFEGGSLLHAPEPGTAKLTVGGKTVEKPLSRNAAYRQLQKANFAQKQARLNARHGTIQEEHTLAPARATEALTAPESTVGRRLKVERRLDQAHEKGDLMHVAQMGKKLSREEHTALRVVAIEGHAALKNPAAVIGRQIATHEAHIAAGEDKAAHLSVIRDLQTAQRVLTNPSQKFSDTLSATRYLSRKGEKESIGRGFLSPTTADERRVAIAKAYGYTGEKPPPGSFYFHAGLGKTKQKGLGRIYDPRPSETGMAPPQIGRYAPELRRQFKGLGITKGKVPLNIPKAVSEGYSRRMVAHSAHDLYGTLQKMSTPARMSAEDIPLRTGTKISSELRKYLTTVEENLHASPDALKEMTKQQVERLTQELEAAQHTHAPLGANIKDVRWVNKKFIKDLGQTSVRGWFEKAADAVTNPIRFGTLYLRGAYALNLIGNAGMLAPEGASAVSAVGRALRMPKRVGDRNTSWADAVMEGGKALGQQVDTGFLHRPTHALAEGWNAVTDLHARRAALEIEMKRAGFKTRQEWDRLRTDPKLAPKRREVIERARAIIGDYENLSPIEKNQIRRALYFYPWTKVAVKWTGHTLGEHPIKSAALTANSRAESEHAKKVLGVLPAWARQTGLVPVGKAHGGLVNTVSPSSINTPSTLVQTGTAAANAVRGIAGMKQNPGGGLKDLLTPAFESFVSGAGGQAPTPGHHTGLLGSLENTPIPSALRRAGIYGKPSKTFPGTGVEPAVAPLFGGGLVPKETSLTALHKSGLKELRAGMSPEQRTAYDFKQWRGRADTILKQHGVTMPKEYAARLDLWHERTVARRTAGKTWASHIEADLGVIYAHGWIDKQQYEAAKANIAKAPKDKQAAITRQLTAEYFDRGGLLHQGAKEMGLAVPH